MRLERHLLYLLCFERTSIAKFFGIFLRGPPVLRNLVCSRWVWRIVFRGFDNLNTLITIDDHPPTRVKSKTEKIEVTLQPVTAIWRRVTEGCWHVNLQISSHWIRTDYKCVSSLHQPIDDQEIIIHRLLIISSCQILKALTDCVAIASRK